MKTFTATPEEFATGEAAQKATRIYLDRPSVDRPKAKKKRKQAAFKQQERQIGTVTPEEFAVGYPYWGHRVRGHRSFPVNKLKPIPNSESTAQQVVSRLLEDGEPFDPRDYLLQRPKNNRRITISFARTTPESAEQGDFSATGWVNEEGVDMEPDEWDVEEGLTAVDKAVKYLKKEGATYPSANFFYPDVWYSSASDVVDYHTGEEEERSYFLKGFDEDELEHVYTRMTQR